MFSNLLTLCYSFLDGGCKTTFDGDFAEHF